MYSFSFTCFNLLLLFIKKKISIFYKINSHWFRVRKKIFFFFSPSIPIKSTLVASCAYPKKPLALIQILCKLFASCVWSSQHGVGYPVTTTAMMIPNFLFLQAKKWKHLHKQIHYLKLFGEYRQVWQICTYLRINRIIQSSFII